MAKKKEIIEEEKEVVTKPKKNGLVPLLCFVIVILIFVIGILVGMNYVKDQQKKDADTKETDKKEKKDKEKEPYVEPVIEPKPEVEPEPEPEKEPEKPKQLSEKELVEKARSFIPFEICNYPQSPLNKKTLTINEMSDDFKGAMVVHSTGHTDPEKDIYIKPEDYAKNFDDLSFLKKLEKDPELEYTSLNTHLFYKNGKYTIQSYATGCEGAHEGLTMYFVGSKIEGNKLTLTYIAYYSTYNYEGEYESMYKEEKDSKPVYEKVTVEEYGDPKMSDGKQIDYTKFDRYNFVFDISNGNLKLQKMVYEGAK